MNEKRMTFCTTCGEDMVPKAMGKLDCRFRCPECGAMHYGKPAKVGKAPACQNCNKLFTDEWKAEPLEDWEAYPAADPCEACQKMTVEAIEAVKSGGIFWKCSDCGMHGALKADHPLSAKVREHTKVKPPKPIGIEFDKANCPSCSGMMLNIPDTPDALTSGPDRL